jgi:hypothetical protein
MELMSSDLVQIAKSDFLSANLYTVGYRYGETP